MIVGGALLCVAGWELYRFGVRAVGFLAGALIGVFVGFALAQLLSLTSYAGWITGGVALIFGLFGLGLAKPLHFLLVFLVGGLVGVLIRKLAIGELGFLFVGDGQSSEWFAITFSVKDLIAAGVGVVAMLVLFKIFAIIGTAFLGGLLVSVGVGIDWLFYVAFGFGLLVQIGLAYPALQRERREEGE